MSILAQLAAQFRAQRPAPPAPYSFPTLTRPTYPDEGFKIADTVKQSGIAAKGQVYAARRVNIAGQPHIARAGFRFALGRGMPPAVSFFASIHPVKPGAPAQTLEGKRDFDPYPDFAFKVDIEGVTDDKLSAHFQKFDGFDLEVEAIEYKAGTDFHVHKRPGVPKYSSIKLSKGIIDNRKLWNWCMETSQGKLTRRNITISVLPESRDENKTLIAYDFIGCWPSKWSGLRLDGKGQGTLIEDIEIVVDEIKLKTS